MISWLKKNRIFSIILAVLIAIEIFYISSLKGGGVGGPQIELIPFTYHITVFFLLNFFIILSIQGKKEMKIKYVLIAIIISLFYAFSDEIHQSFIPSRFPSLHDIFIDSAGIFFSTIVYFFSEKKIFNQ